MTNRSQFFHTGAGGRLPLLFAVSVDAGPSRRRIECERKADVIVLTDTGILSCNNLKMANSVRIIFGLAVVLGSLFFLTSKYLLLTNSKYLLASAR